MRLWASREEEQWGGQSRWETGGLKDQSHGSGDGRGRWMGVSFLSAAPLALVKDGSDVLTYRESGIKEDSELSVVTGEGEYLGVEKSRFSVNMLNVEILIY